MNYRSLLVGPPNTPLLDDLTAQATISTATVKRSWSPLASQKKVTTKRRVVHFCEDSSVDISIAVHLIPSLSDMTAEEKESCWLTRRDHEKIEQQIRLDIIRSKLQHHHQETDLIENHDSRGLEWMTFDGVRQRNSNRRNGIIAVLEEQERQRSTYYPEDTINQSLIAYSYQKAVEHCQGKARQTAIHDSMIASKIYNVESLADAKLCP